MVPASAVYLKVSTEATEVLTIQSGQSNVIHIPNRSNNQLTSKQEIILAIF